MSDPRKVTISMSRRQTDDESRALVSGIAETFIARELLLIECVYSEPWDAQELARLERRLNGAICYVLRDCLGLPVAKRAKLLRFNMAAMVHIPDGNPDDKNIVISLDWPKLIGAKS